jgi:hypothetical protein
MFRRSAGLATLVAAVLAAGIAHAQAPLGFTIDPTQGRTGDTVNGQVNPLDVAASCVTELDPFIARFNELFQGPFVSGNTVGELPQTWFPDPDNIVYENADQMAYVLTLLVVLGIANDLQGAAQAALPQTFVMTFADIVTQDPVGPRGGFDPATGVGSVLVPDVAPGLWAVAAACVGPTLDIPTLQAGIEQSGDFLESIGIQFGPDGPSSPEFEAFAQEFLDSDLTGFDLLVAFVNAIGPTLLEPIVVPDALGIQLFTVLPPLVSHFQCYDVRNVPFASQQVTLTDVFGSRSAEVRRFANLCAPSDKNAEDPGAPSDEAFLASYELRKPGAAAMVAGQTVTNQFGTLSLDVRSPRSLLVPSSFSTTEPPSSVTGAFLDHFTCYDVRVTNRTPKFESRTVSVTTPFETVDVLVRKPHRLCVPVNKHGEDPDAPGHPQSLLCYLAKAPGKVTSPVFIRNQFGAQENDARKRNDFCVPTELGGSPSGAFL